MDREKERHLDNSIRSLFQFIAVIDDETGLDEYIEMADRKMYEMRVIRDEHRRE
ncbi:MAG: hypothetical protein K6F73_04875 [Lachnospiraceae bacterium]|nr:hypothetical protein [Lachnospiraceae bacterium]